MTKLPVVSAKQLISALKKAGYEIDHQKGSHIALYEIKEPYKRVTIPNHKEISKGTLKKILSKVGVTADELSELL